VKVLLAVGAPSMRRCRSQQSSQRNARPRPGIPGSPTSGLHPVRADDRDGLLDLQHARHRPRRDRPKPLVAGRRRLPPAGWLSSRCRPLGSRPKTFAKDYEAAGCRARRSPSRATVRREADASQRKGVFICRPPRSSTPASSPPHSASRS